MKNKRKGFAGWSITFFMLMLGVALFSWIGSIYGIGNIQSLLSAEGVRWLLGHVMSNYMQTPALGIVLVLMMGLGVGMQSGLSKTDCPRAFKGFPITLISAGLLALAFMGFSGLKIF